MYKVGLTMHNLSSYKKNQFIFKSADDRNHCESDICSYSHCSGKQPVQEACDFPFSVVKRATGKKSTRSGSCWTWRERKHGLNKQTSWNHSHQAQDPAVLALSGSPFLGSSWLLCELPHTFHFRSRHEEAGWMCWGIFIGDRGEFAASLIRTFLFSGKECHRR